MKYFLCFLVVMGLGKSLNAQMNPIKWKVRAEKVELDHYKLIISAQMESGWMVYSQHTPEGGPIPTEIKFSKTEGVTLEGKVLEPEAIKDHDPFFDTEVWKFKKNVNFQQFFKKTEEKGLIHGHITFMTCDGMRCLPPKTQDFTVFVD